MSRPTPRRLLALALSAVLLVPGTAWARQTERELVRQLDSLMPLLEQAKLDAEAAREARREELAAKQPMDTVDIGLLRVLVPPGQDDAARNVIGAVWDRDFAAFVDRSPSLARQPIFFQWAVDLEPYRTSALRFRAVDGRAWRTRAYMEDQAQLVIGESLKDDLSGTRFLERWGIANVGPPRDAQDLYRSMVVAPSVAVRRCMGGDGEGCLVTLGLRDDGYAIDDWYSPEERRLIVVRQPARFAREREKRQACVQGALQACDAVIRTYSEQYQETRWASPVSTEVHATIVWYALQQGGPGAWGRLLDHAEDDPLGALEAASGMDAATLAAGWRAWLVESGPPARAGWASLSLGASFWLLLLITLASRSTRWRLG